MPYPGFQAYPYINPYQQMVGQLPVQNQVQQSPPQIQNGGFIMVKSIDEARNYPVAPGNSITFKNENAPYVYTKTLGFSQLDQPIFESFRLVKEDDVVFMQDNKKEDNDVRYLTFDEAQDIISDISNIKDEMNFLKQYIEVDTVKESDSDDKH